MAGKVVAPLCVCLHLLCSGVLRLRWFQAIVCRVQNCAIKCDIFALFAPQIHFYIALYNGVNAARGRACLFIKLVFVAHDAAASLSIKLGARWCGFRYGMSFWLICFYTTSRSWALGEQWQMMEFVFKMWFIIYIYWNCQTVIIIRID